MSHKKHGPGNCCCTQECTPHEFLFGDGTTPQPADPTDDVLNEDSAWTLYDGGNYWTYTTAAVDKWLLVDWDDKTGGTSTSAHVNLGFTWKIGQTIRLVFLWQDADNYWAIQLAWIDDGGGLWHIRFKLLQVVSGAETVYNDQPAPTQMWGLFSGFRAYITYDATSVKMLLIELSATLGSRVTAFGWPECPIGVDLPGKFGVRVTVNDWADDVTINRLAIDCEPTASVCDRCPGGLVPFARYQITISNCTGVASWANGTYVVTGTFINGTPADCVWQLTTGEATLELTYHATGMPFTARITSWDGKWIEWQSDSSPTCVQEESFGLAWYQEDGMVPSSDTEACEITVQAVLP